MHRAIPSEGCQLRLNTYYIQKATRHAKLHTFLVLYEVKIKIYISHNFQLSNFQQGIVDPTVNLAISKNLYKVSFTETSICTCQKWPSKRRRPTCSLAEFPRSCAAFEGRKEGRKEGGISERRRWREGKDFTEILLLNKYRTKIGKQRPDFRQI